MFFSGCVTEGDWATGAVCAGCKAPGKDVAACDRTAGTVEVGEVLPLDV